MQTAGRAQDDSPAENAAALQDKLEQKRFFKRNNIPTGAFVAVDSAEDLQEAADRFGLPFMLKSCRRGPDEAAQTLAGLSEVC